MKGNTMHQAPDKNGSGQEWGRGWAGPRRAVQEGPGAWTVEPSVAPLPSTSAIATFLAAAIISTSTAKDRGPERACGALRVTQEVSGRVETRPGLLTPCLALFPSVPSW